MRDLTQDNMKKMCRFEFDTPVLTLGELLGVFLFLFKFLVITTIKGIFKSSGFNINSVINFNNFRNITSLVMLLQ